MRVIEQEGKTPDEAIAIALKELGLRREDVKVEILDEGNKGLFGLMGSKMAKVKIVVDKEIDEAADRVLAKILELMGIEAKVKVKEEERITVLEIESPDAALIIGKRGQTLTSIQEIVNLVINNKAKDQQKVCSQQKVAKRVVLDTEGYRQRRKEALTHLALKVANDVRRTRRAVTLEPMNAYERHIIHAALQEYRQVSTTSSGEGDQRRVVISLKERSY